MEGRKYKEKAKGEAKAKAEEIIKEG